MVRLAWSSDRGGRRPRRRRNIEVGFANQKRPEFGLAESAEELREPALRHIEFERFFGRARNLADHRVGPLLRERSGYTCNLRISYVPKPKPTQGVGVSISMMTAGPFPYSSLSRRLRSSSTTLRWGVVGNRQIPSLCGR